MPRLQVWETIRWSKWLPSMAGPRKKYRVSKPARLIAAKSNALCAFPIVSPATTDPMMRFTEISNAVCEGSSMNRRYRAIHWKGLHREKVICFYLPDYDFNALDAGRRAILPKLPSGDALQLRTYLSGMPPFPKRNANSRIKEPSGGYCQSVNFRMVG